MDLVKFFTKFDKKLDSNARSSELNTSDDSGVVSNRPLDSSWSVFSFTGKTYPLLFFSRLFLSRSNFFDSQVTVIDFDDISLDSFLGQLHMSFLGQNNTYWCKNVSILDAKQRKQFLLFAQAYQGPHKLIFFTSDPVDFSQNSQALTVDLEDSVDSGLYDFLYQKLYGADVAQEQKKGADCAGFTKALFAKNKSLTLDAACLMMGYNAAIGERDREVCTEWSERLIAPEMSLFTLSQYFFAKESGKFFQLWNELEQNFPLEFWVSFWSEQLWQATIFIDGIIEYGPVAARKRVNRLPFSFMQKDYRRFTKRELTVAHNFLYSVDYGSKNGHASFGLELFFFQFLQSKFAQK